MIDKEFEKISYEELNMDMKEKGVLANELTKEINSAYNEFMEFDVMGDPDSSHADLQGLKHAILTQVITYIENMQ